VRTKLGLFSRLGKDEHASSPRLLARLFRDEEGSYLLYMTLLMPFLIGVAGLATEGGLIFLNHRTVQSAADAAVYSAAVAYSIDSSADITTQAQAIVANYGFVVGTGNNQANVVATVDTTTYSPLTAINVSVTRPQLPFLSSVWVTSAFNVSGSAKAIISGGSGGGNGNCMLGLAPTGTDIQLQGPPAINAGGCGIFSNSNGSCAGAGSATPSINLGGNGIITGGAVGAAGCISVTGSSSIGPPPNGYTSGDSPVINPYANTTVPTPGACLPNNTGVVKGTGSTPAVVTLNPGTYCTGGINIKNANVTLNPGIYILDGPVQFIVDSTATLTGKGVTLVFTDPGSAAYPNAPGSGNTPTAMNIISGATVNLQAPTSGATQGMLIIGDSNIPIDTAFNYQANAAGTSCDNTSTICTGGVIYVPTGDFTWQGGPILTGGCTQMIAYRLTMAGNATFNNSNCNLSGGGGGGGAKPIGNVVTLVQ
jgi:Flp pilus assembly protein TadG